MGLSKKKETSHCKEQNYEAICCFYFKNEITSPPLVDRDDSLSLKRSFSKRKMFYVLALFTNLCHRFNPDLQMCI